MQNASSFPCGFFSPGHDKTFHCVSELVSKKGGWAIAAMTRTQWNKAVYEMDNFLGSQAYIVTSNEGSKKVDL